MVWTFCAGGEDDTMIQEIRAEITNIEAKLREDESKREQMIFIRENCNLQTDGTTTPA